MRVPLLFGKYSRMNLVLSCLSIASVVNLFCGINICVGGIYLAPGIIDGIGLSRVIGALFFILYYNELLF